MRRVRQRHQPQQLRLRRHPVSARRRQLPDHLRDEYLRGVWSDQLFHLDLRIHSKWISEIDLCAYAFVALRFVCDVGRRRRATGRSVEEGGGGDRGWGVGGDGCVVGRGGAGRALMLGTQCCCLSVQPLPDRLWPMYLVFVQPRL